MSVYKKLQDARLMLQNTKLTKSGKNKFAGYEYFVSLAALPPVQWYGEPVGHNEHQAGLSDVYRTYLKNTQKMEIAELMLQACQSIYHNIP